MGQDCNTHGLEHRRQHCRRQAGGLAQLVHQGAHALHRPQGHGQNQRSGGQRENQTHLLRPLLHHHGAHSGGYGGGGNLQNILHGSQPEQVFNQFKQAADLLHHHH